MNGDPGFRHDPVMPDEVVEVLGTTPPGVIVDATVGGGGHADLLLRARTDIELLAIDRDRSALSAAAARLEVHGDRVSLHHGRFDELGDIVHAAGHDHIVGALFDLGVSSPQLDLPERGFSYNQDGPLDMRMDPSSSGPSAADLVNAAPADELAAILRRHADERYARRIAAAIVAARPVAGTSELAEIVRDAIPAPARRRGGHPARRTFQALRVAVNDELTQIQPALTTAIDLLVPGGRCAVLAYHSGEDRLVKECFRNEAGEAPPPRPGLPHPPGTHARVRLLWRGARAPGDTELARNRRAEAARMRAVERTGD